MSERPSSSSGNPVRALADCEILELGHELFVGSPRLPVHTPFMYTMTGLHCTDPGMPDQPPEITGAGDMFAMGVHCGTHIDALSHIACHACLADGTIVTDPGVEDYRWGIRMKSGPAMRSILAPAVLLDFPAFFGVKAVADDLAITPDHIEACAAHQRVSIDAGDAVLFRTGRDLLVSDPVRFTSFPMAGPNLDSAKYLVARGVPVTGSDTLAYERMPGEHPLEVHAELIAKAGIHIIEGLNLAEPGARRIYRFILAILPLRIRGATGSPVNPVALVPRTTAG